MLYFIPWKQRNDTMKLAGEPVPARACLFLPIDRRTVAGWCGHCSSLGRVAMSDAILAGFLIRGCRTNEIEQVLELWRQAEATPSVTDNADDLRRAVVDGP